MTFIHYDIFRQDEYKNNSAYKRRIEPFNKIDELINFSHDSSKRSVILANITEKRIREICIYPFRMTIEEAAIIAAAHRLNTIDVLLIATEDFARHLIETDATKKDVHKYRELFKIQSQRLRVHPKGQGLLRDVQRSKTVFFSKRKKARHSEGSDYSIGL